MTTIPMSCGTTAYTSYPVPEVTKVCEDGRKAFRAESVPDLNRHRIGEM